MFLFNQVIEFRIYKFKNHNPSNSKHQITEDKIEKKRMKQTKCATHASEGCRNCERSAGICTLKAECNTKNFNHFLTLYQGIKRLTAQVKLTLPHYRVPHNTTLMLTAQLKPRIKFEIDFQTPLFYYSCT